MRLTAVLILTALLAACGVDGEPRPPSSGPEPTPSGLTGSVQVGVSYS